MLLLTSLPPCAPAFKTHNATVKSVELFDGAKLLVVLRLHMLLKLLDRGFEQNYGTVYLHCGTDHGNKRREQRKDAGNYLPGHKPNQSSFVRWLCFIFFLSLRLSPSPHREYHKKHDRD